MILELVDEADPILHRPTEPVKKITEVTKSFIDNLIRTMRSHKGMGLAANQVGSELRIAVVENKKLLSRTLIMINPEVTSESDEQTDECEACLSIPKKSFVVRRPTWVTIKYLDKNGKECSYKAKNLMARIVAHELDHLFGITIRDKAEEIK